MVGFWTVSHCVSEYREGEWAELNFPRDCLISPCCLAQLQGRGCQ